MSDSKSSLPSEPVPFSTQEAAVEVAGSALHWRSSLERILRRAGVAQAAVDRNKQQYSKYQVIRAILGELESAGPRGWQVQRNIVIELSSLQRVEDKAPDHEAGKRAIEELRRIAENEKIIVSPEEAERKKKKEDYVEKAEQNERRAAAIDHLNSKFLSLFSIEDHQRQRRGYELERILRELFRVNELTYSGSYKTDIDQVDGTFDLDSFTYLLEARWRAKPAVEDDLASFINKVDRRIGATRGLFLSMAGFRDEVIALHRLAKDNKIFLADGEDLSLILNGHFQLPEALREKIKAASVLGEPFQRLRELQPR